MSHSPGSAAAASGLARRAHPSTPFTVAACLAVAVFLVPAPWGPLILYALALLLVVAGGSGRAVRQGLIVLMPLWFFLVLLHGVLGEGPTIMLGPLHFSETGLRSALAQAGRLGAIVTASLGAYHAFDPARFLDAVAARGWSFHSGYLVVATLDAAPRFRRRATAILEAQRVRGLRLRGSLLNRIRALPALVMPLLFGALAEADERGMALEMRGAGSSRRRTPLRPPRDTAADRTVRWGSVLLVSGILAWRLLS
ncbi:MAG: energy-coupling factor transporter transmembrane component T [Gemmatimonadales bacterium]